MIVEIQEELLVIEDFYSWFFIYFFIIEVFFCIEGIFEVEQDIFDKIFEVGEWIICFCVYDIYMDCFYYEESQFEGDIWVQVLVSYVLFGDVSLGKNVIE